jgi:Spy/CpxP family protein refolding chaperone
MRRQFGWILAAVLIGVPVFAAAQNQAQTPPRTGQTGQPVQNDRQSRDSRPQDPNRWKYWMNPEYRKELGITDAQSVKIEEIFQTLFPAQRANIDEVEKLEPVLASMIKESTAEVSAVKALVERVEKLHAERRTMRAVMLYKMGLVLSPEQRVKLEEFTKKRREENNRRRSSDKNDHRH